MTTPTRRWPRSPSIASQGLPAVVYYRHPFQVFTLLLAVASGVPLLLGDAAPGTVEATLSPAAVTFWGVSLVAGAGTTLAGMLWPRRITGMALEQVGLVAIGTASAIYTVCIFSFWGIRGVTAAAYVMGFATASFWRWGQIQQVMGLLRTLARAEPDG